MPVKVNKGQPLLYPMQSCPVLKEIELIRKKWMLALLLEMFSSKTPLHFSSLQRALHPITPKILTQRLSELEKGGFITKKKKSENEAEYSLAPKSVVLRNLIGVLKHNCLLYSKEGRKQCASCKQREHCVLAYGV